MSLLKRVLVISSLLIFSILLFLAVMKVRDLIGLKVADFLIIQDNPAPADVIHVIAGDDYRTEYAI